MGRDWIKLFPRGDYSFTATGEVRYELTYPLPVLQALIDETHRLGKKAACHLLGGVRDREIRSQRNEIDLMAAKGIYYDPTFVRYTEPYMDDFGCLEYRRQIQNHPDL